jgi:hypothetical protein
MDVEVWVHMISKVSARYGERSWSQVLSGKRAALELLKLAYFSVGVERDHNLLVSTPIQALYTQLDSTRPSMDAASSNDVGDVSRVIKVETLENRGLILLTPSYHKTKYFISLSPIFYHLIDVAFELNIFDSYIFDRFVSLDEDEFPKYVAAMHCATYRLLTLEHELVQVPRGLIYRNKAVGNAELLKEMVTISGQVKIRVGTSYTKERQHVSSNRNQVHSRSTPLLSTPHTHSA